MKVLVSLFCLLLLLPLPMAAQAATVIADAKVVDGDTLSFEGLGVTVRLDGIDAPESRQSLFHKSEKSLPSWQHRANTRHFQGIFPVKHPGIGNNPACFWDVTDLWNRLSGMRVGRGRAL